MQGFFTPSDSLPLEDWSEGGEGGREGGNVNFHFETNLKLKDTLTTPKNNWTHCLCTSVSFSCLCLLFSRMVGDHMSSLSPALTTFSFPVLMGVEVTKLPLSVSERLSEPGLTLNRRARLLGGATGLDFWIGTEEEEEEEVGEWVEFVGMVRGRGHAVRSAEEDGRRETQLLASHRFLIGVRR